MRACCFGTLTIFCIMVGLSFQPRTSFQAGGILTLLMVAILLFKAREAPTKNHRHTEVWLYLPKELRPPERSAQRTISVLMRETYLTFAYWTATIAVVMWVLALLCAFFDL